MKNTLQEYIKKFQKDRKNRRKYQLLFLILAFVTFAVVGWNLHGTGIAVTADYECGKEDHLHDKDCYELVCTQDGEDGNIAWSEIGSEETDEEMETESVDADESGDDNEEEEKMIVSSDSDADRDDSKDHSHIHTKKCYRLVCTIPEHQHSIKCMTNLAADVETKNDWEETIPDLTGDTQAQKMIAVAESQIGYHESEENFKLADDGVTKQGYTRYGEWYGNPYGSWSAMFASFVLHYAGVPKSEFPLNSGCPAWITELNRKGIYENGDVWEPNYGDLVFLDLDEDGQADHVGIITDLTLDEEEETVSSLTAVVGDLEDEVQETVIEAGDQQILGYGVLPENGVSVLPADDAALDMSGNVTSLTGSGTIYDAKGNLYSSNLQMNFAFETSDVKANGRNYYYEYPDGIIIPAGLLTDDRHDLLDSDGKKAGTYHFVKTEDGKYRVEISFDDSYVAQNQDSMMKGFVSFKGQISADKADKDGTITVAGSDNVTLVIPKSEIEYPEDETNHYDISTSKSGSYQVKDGKLVYTVYVSSIKGTPGEIAFEDTIRAEGMTLGEPTVKVTKQKVSRYYNSDGGSWDSSSVKEEGEISAAPSYSQENSTGHLSMTLPKIDPAEEKREGNGTQYKEYTRYKVEYTYDVSDLAAQPKASNSVNVSSRENETEVRSKADYTIGIRNEHDINKYGWFDPQRNQIRWTITINSNQIDIAGSTLTDEMLAKIAEGTNLSIRPETGYEITRDGEKITGIRFTAVENGKNTNSYEIIYWTKAEAKWGDQQISNEAKFQPGDGSSEIDKTGTVTVGGGDIAKKVGTADISEDGNTLVIPWEASLTIPAGGLPKNTVIKDDPTKNQWGGSGSRHYMTRAQVRAWADGIYWVNDTGAQVGGKVRLTAGELADVRFLASDGQEYSWSEINSGSDPKFDALSYTIWTVELKNDLSQPSGAKKLIFSYHTTAEIGSVGIGKVYYHNTIEAGNKKVSATYEYKKGGLIKTDENGSENKTSKVNEDGTLIWKITADLAEQSDYINITDTLPDGVDLISLKGDGAIRGLSSITIGADGTISGHGNGYQLSGTYQGQTVTLHLERKDTNKLDANTYTIIVTCRVDKTKLENYESGVTYTFTNKASAENDKKSMGSDQQEQEWTEKTNIKESKVVDKSGEWDNNTRRVKYSVCLNPDGKDIVKGSGVLSLKDVMEYNSELYAIREGTYGPQVTYNLNAWLIPDSVHLYRALKQADGTLVPDAEITNWKWTVESGTKQYQPKIHLSTFLAQNLPDETPMILKYEYQFQSDVPDGWKSSSNMYVHNSAELTGTGYKDDKTQDDTSWSEQSHSGGITIDKRYTIYKVSTGNFGETLSGAVFRLQKWDGAAYEDTGRTFTTDQDGKIVIQWMQSDGSYDANTLYRLIETSAPDGHLLPADPEENAVYFFFSDSSDTEHQLPESLPANAYDLTQGSRVAYVENEATETKISINKEWQNVDGSRTDGTGKSDISVTLYQRESTTAPSEGTTAKLTGKITQGNEWGSELKNIENEYPAGTRIDLSLTVTKNDDGEPVMKLNGTDLTASINTEGDRKTYQYSFVLKGGENRLQGIFPGWNQNVDPETQISDLSAAIPSAREYNRYTLSADDNWEKTIDGLPAVGVNGQGEKVYYSYYIEETDAGGDYDITYENNGGIASGTITVTNRSRTDENYRLPETGEMGNIPFRVAGLVILGLTMLSGRLLRRREE